MLLYYAPGAGLGHLTRARAFLHTLGLEAGAVLVTDSPHAGDPRLAGPVPVLAVPAAVALEAGALRAWLERLVHERRPEVLVADAFPGGLRGELCGVRLSGSTALEHVARLLRWPAYAPVLAAGPPPRFRRTYTVEPLAGGHHAFLERASDALEPLELVDPPHPPGLDAASLPPQDGRPVWLVVHAGPAAEQLELVAYALELEAHERTGCRLLLVAPSAPAGLPPGVEHRDVLPAAALFPHASRVVTACGFNAMRQALPYRDRHRFVPFFRRFDDQHERARRRRALASGGSAAP